MRKVKEIQCLNKLADVDLFLQINFLIKKHYNIMENDLTDLSIIVSFINSRVDWRACFCDRIALDVQHVINAFSDTVLKLLTSSMNFLEL